MRRLYGDMESNSVYREMRSTGSNMARAAEEAKAKEAKEANPSSASENNFPLDHNLFSSLEYNIRLGSGLGPVGTVQARKPPMKKKVKLIKKKRLKKKPSSTEGSDVSESTTAEGASDGEIGLHAGAV